MAAFELHIEQGPILEDEGIDIGVVTHSRIELVASYFNWAEVTLDQHPCQRE